MGGRTMSRLQPGWTRQSTAPRVVAAVALVLLAASAVSAELLVFHDSAGRSTVFDSEDPYHPFRIPTDGSAIELDSTAITFSITYLDVTGATGSGFDDPVRGATRRATVDAVLAYIESVLNESGAVQMTW